MYGSIGETTDRNCIDFGSVSDHSLMAHLDLGGKSGPGIIFIAVYALLTCVVVCGFLANALLIYSVLRLPSLRRSPTYLTLVSLAVSDIFSLLTGLLNFWNFYTLQSNRYFCAFICFSMSVGISSSTYHLMTFSVLRYIILVKPLFAMKHLTVKTSVLVCIVVWIVAGILSLPSAFFSRVVPLNTTQNSSSSICIEESSSNAHAIYTVTSMVFLPMVLTMGFHLSKVCHLRRRLQHGNGRHTSFKIVISILITFWVTNVPGCIYWIISYNMETEDEALQKYTVPAILFGLCNINSAVDPLFYFYFSKRIRKDICCCRNGFDERQMPINVTPGNNPAIIKNDHSLEQVLGHQSPREKMSTKNNGLLSSEKQQEDKSLSVSSSPYHVKVTQM